RMVQIFKLFQKLALVQWVRYATNSNDMQQLDQHSRLTLCTTNFRRVSVRSTVVTWGIAIRT
ncbi:MAG: hypothetical protein EZS28_028406, partial [Streblomastix strix]